MTTPAAPTASERGRLVAPALLALTVLAAALRLPFLEAQSLTYDETFTREIVALGSFGDLWSNIKATEATPPLGYLLGWLWCHLVGSTSDAAIRFVPAVAGVAVVPATFFAFRRFVGERVAMATAALAAVSPILVSYSLIARSYMVVVLLAVSSLWALGALAESFSTRRLGLWALACAACLWTHYYALFLVTGEIVVLLWLLPRMRVRVIAASAFVGVAALPLLTLLADQSDGRSDNIGSFSLADRVEQTVRMFGMGSNPPGALIEGIGLALAAGGFVAGAWILGRGSRRLGRVPLLLAVGVPLLSLLLDAVGLENHFFMRNLLPVWTCVAAVVAAGLVRLRGVPLACYAVVCVVAVLVVNTDWRYQNAANWRAAAEAVPPGRAPVLVYPGFGDRVAERYLGGQRSPGTVTRSLVVVVEPGRAGRRDLRPLPDFPRGGIPGFVLRGAEERDGMRVLRFSAPRPTPVNPAALAQDVLGQQPALIVGTPANPLRGG
jgi:uncharacterized membrane protein